MSMQQTAILLVEGRRAGDDSFATSLEKAKYELIVAHTGRTALKRAQQTPPALVVFDASTMRSSGVRTCARLRRELGDTPIIHCRRDGDGEDHAAGADVYLMKPFTPRKLLNRVRDLLPVDMSKEEIVHCGRLHLYRGKRAVEVDGLGERRLTPKLALLLETFLRHPNETITRRQLMKEVWQTDYVGDTRTLDVHIRWVRECIEKDPAEPELLQTVRGEGYRFVMSPV